MGGWAPWWKDLPGVGGGVMQAKCQGGVVLVAAVGN